MIIYFFTWTKILVKHKCFGGEFNVLLIIFINIMVIFLGFIISDLLDGKDTKMLNRFCKLEYKKYLIRRNIID